MEGFVVRTALAAMLGLAVLAGTANAATGLNAYRVKATGENLRALAAQGFDLTEGRNLDRGTIDVVGSAEQIGAAKVDARKVTDNGAVQLLADPTAGASDAAFDVWTKYDAVDGDDKEQYTEQYERLVTDNPGLVAKYVPGQSVRGRDIVALQVTKDATGEDIPGRPAVLYNAMQHAREWLAGETCRRTLDYFADNYGKTHSAGLEVTQLVDTRELWFVCVNNPDGYEFTFTPGNRLWRKNLRDNDGDGVIKTGDGVDPNRNFSSNWGRDDDGSSPDPASETYRGPSPASEPETTAMHALFDEIHPVFHKNDHTAAQLLLYPQGFQQDTPSADHEIFTALAGDPFKPAIPGFPPELSAGLYITNGDFTDWAYNVKNALSFTPEGTAAEDPNLTGFEYPDSELQIEQEFDRHLSFALDLAKSADQPDEPDSHLDNGADDFTVGTFAESYGDPQPVGATVKRKLGAVQMKFKVNGGATKVVPTVPYNGGERYYKDKGVYYQRVRAFVVGTTPGDAVEVWFTAGDRASAHFTYQATVESDKPVLILSNEDYSGRQPNANPIPGPRYLDPYRAALDAAGVQYDIYDVDAHGRRAPDPLGILAHYSHVVWYTGDDYVPREPDAPGGSGITRLAVDTQNAVRDFINDGGKLFFTGKNAGRVFSEGYKYNPFQVEENTYCQNANPSCIVVQDDFLQYWLGAYRYVVGAGEDATGQPFGVQGTVNPFDALSLTFNGADSAQNNDSTATLLTTSSVLDPVRYPLFADSRAAARWLRPGASPFAPHAGSWFLSAGADDVAYKRLLKPFAIPAGGGAVKLWTSFDLEPDYDYMFVEIHRVGHDDWTTLADANNHTHPDVGLSCPTTGGGSAWHTNHPFLAHYQTVTNAGADCLPTGSSGAWNAATGNSGGWQEWSLPIPAQYHGQNVEISVSVATDPASLGLGAWVDELKVVDSAANPINSADPSFETGMDGWTLPGPPGPAGAAGQSRETGWVRAQNAPFVETPVVTTTDTVYTGFGFEAITGAANRAAFMQAALTHLGAPRKPAFDAPAAQTETSGTPPGGGSDPGPGPPPGTTPPGTTTPSQLLNRLNLLLNRRQSLREVRRRGVLATLGCNRRCVVRVDLVVSRATQLRLRLPSRRIGRRTYVLPRAGRRTLRIPLSAAAKRRLLRTRSLQVSVRATWTGVRPAVRRSGTVRLR
ncbi:MAG TPA: M14 family metallopeptidase [Solirubrobacteraceae bacterium]|nr:M14 family metallopeptidase [Solirubrobacteraceae bacterium]